MKRQILKFEDIRGMLNEDEMRGIVGGSGGVELNPYGSQYIPPTPLTYDPSSVSLGYADYLSSRRFTNGAFDAQGIWHQDKSTTFTSGSGYSNYQGSPSLTGSEELNYLTSATGFNDWVNAQSQAYSNASFFAGMANWGEGKYVNIGNGTFVQIPPQDICEIPQPGRVSVGPITATGITQSLRFTNAGSYVGGMGGFAAVMTTAGNIGFSLNEKGEWIAGASLDITPPAPFEHPSVSVNVYVSVNGVSVGSFTLQDPRNYGSVIHAPNTIPMSGSFVMPSSFNGQGNVTFQIYSGALTNDGNDNYSTNSSHSVTLTLPKIKI